MAKLTFNPPVELKRAVEKAADKRNLAVSAYITLTLARELHVDLPEGCFKTGPKKEKQDVGEVEDYAF